MSKILVRRYRWSTRDLVEIEYRCDPVPGTRCRRGSCYGRSWHKYPPTQPERRAWYNAIDQDVIPRARRNPTRLPTAYDDILRGDDGIRNWKKFRKTQWKT